MKSKPRNYTPVTVPFAATPAGSPPSVDAWANRAVWTDCMLTALQRGVRGGRWHTLGDKVWNPLNLHMAARHVIANDGAAGVDHVTATQFENRLMAELRRIESELQANAYRPQQIRRTYIKKLGSPEKRPLGIPTVRDRVIQTALLHVLEPIFDVTFHERSFGFRRGRGCHHALEQVETLLTTGHTFVVDADLKGYLNPLDHHLSSQGFELVRYADDFVVMCRTQAEAERALEVIRVWVEENGLTLHPTKTRIADYHSPEGFAFLGDLFKKGRIIEPRPKSAQKLKDSLRAKTKRTNGTSCEVIIQSVNATLRGWMATSNIVTGRSFVTTINGCGTVSAAFSGNERKDAVEPEGLTVGRGPTNSSRRVDWLV